MQTTKVISTLHDAMNRLLIKVYRYGTSDVQTPLQANPAGIDSNPIKDMVAVYAATDDKGTKVIIGYLNKNQLSQPGEARMFSTDADGNIKTFVWVKNDGKIQLGGTANNLVFYAAMNDAINKTLIGLVPQLQLELTKIATGIVAGGGTYTPGTLTCDLSAAKTLKITTE